MINPSNITNFERTDKELQEFALFAPSVAGKTAKIQSQKLDDLIENLDDRFGGVSPYDNVRAASAAGVLEEEMRNVKLGKYSILLPCFITLAMLGCQWLKRCDVEDMKAVPGIGDKTARFFIMHTRPDANVATLDTHVLKWMEEELGIETPDGTPSSTRVYKKLEHRFLKAANEMDRHPAHLDLEIWNEYSHA